MIPILYKTPSTTFHKYKWTCHTHGEYLNLCNFTEKKNYECVDINDYYANDDNAKILH